MGIKTNGKKRVDSKGPGKRIHRTIMLKVIGNKIVAYNWDSLTNLRDPIPYSGDEWEPSNMSSFVSFVYSRCHFTYRWYNFPMTRHFRWSSRREILLKFLESFPSLNENVILLRITSSFYTLLNNLMIKHQNKRTK